MKTVIWSLCFLTFTLANLYQAILADEIKESENVDPIHYKKGSICGYCIYCRFCALCDKDCPCSEGQGKPNCHMCKYCKYCYLCSAFCDTICTPGGIIDTVSSALLSNIPFNDEEEIKQDLESVKKYLK